MRIIRDVREMQRFSDEQRLQGKRIALVPTMGFLHEGHLSLMREGRKRADVLVTSIFVNPTQFGANEDLDAYPRDFERDERLMKGVGVDVVFYPTVQGMYPRGYQTYVKVEELTENLCGRSRPVHFRGVATVVTKLFNLVRPHVALFGQKDYQQLVVVRRLAEDLGFEIEVVGCETVREPDGLAMSSRNAYLSPEEREEAVAIRRALDAAIRLYEEGERDTGPMRETVRRVLSGQPHTRIDYIHVCDTRTLRDVERIEKEAVLAVAAYVGETRLIDNCVFAGHPERRSEGMHQDAETLASRSGTRRTSVCNGN